LKDDLSHRKLKHLTQCFNASNWNQDLILAKYSSTKNLIITHTLEQPFAVLTKLNILTRPKNVAKILKREADSQKICKRVYTT
jgi:hypothetical protein